MKNKLQDEDDRLERKESNNWRSFEVLFSKLPAFIIGLFSPGGLIFSYWIQGYKSFVIRLVNIPVLWIKEWEGKRDESYGDRTCNSGWIPSSRAWVAEVEWGWCSLTPRRAMSSCDQGGGWLVPMNSEVIHDNPWTFLEQKIVKQMPMSFIY